METDVLTDMILSEVDKVQKRLTRSSDTRNTKIKRAASQMSTYEGRRKHDILYQKMVKYRDLYNKYRALLKQKYQAKNVKQARR